MAIDVILGSLHVIGFSVYIGGLFFMEAVLAPAQSAISPAQAGVIAKKTGDRQMIVAWSALALIIVTGILRLSREHMLDASGTLFLDSNIASSGYGTTIFVMLGLWCALVALGLVMTFVLRPILTGKISPTMSADEQSKRQDKMVSAARWMGIVMRVDLLLVVVAAVLGVSLRFGGVF